ncbi:alpha/beta fold hydrolase [Oceanobacillus senegalensis]|uniref:alpha/beta fold hydrolase n=1 Tax=Oceanobacillus senegalensis TaxID=1936063 RepID=UPI000A30561B|nr:alpha/beta fold hydrolase [Oceanobacillus senegalensis]
MKIKLKHGVSVGLLIACIACIFIYVHVPNEAKSENNFGVPTVFVHGYKGTKNSFGSMLERFEDNGWGKKRFIYYVSSRGRLTDHYVNKEASNQTFVQIILRNNRASFSDSTEWLATVLRHLKDKYDIDTINLVGHSMGGLISMKYMMEYQSNDFPKVHRFVAIGSPFDGIYSQKYFKINHDRAATDLKPHSLAFQLLHKGRIPREVEVLNIGSTGDPISIPKSVKAIRKMVHPSQLTEIIVQNDKLGHSELHESLQVDKMIHSFLWQDEGL